MDWTETEAKNTQQGRGREPGDNVVRLPRDWLGPREELVPFGPPAEPEAEPGADGAEPADSGVPPSAHDFWDGGDFSSAHDGFQEPVRRNRRRRWPGHPRSFVAVSRARQGLIAGATVVTLLVAGMLVAAGTRRSPPSKPPPRPSSEGHTGTLAARPTGIKAGKSGRSVLKALDRTDRVRERTPPRPVHRTPSPRRATDRRARHRNSARHTLRKATSTAQPVGYTTSTPPAPAASETTASSGPSASSASATAASSPPSSAAAMAGGGSSGGGAGSGSGSSSSTSQPATGANGTLGPGSSPDG